MKLKTKVLFASLALLFAMPASAQIDDAASGNSSLILTLIDTTRDVSATFDLGVNKNTFSTGTSTSFNLTTADYLNAWNSFTTGVTWSNVQYSVVALDNSGSVNSIAGNRSLFATATGNMSGVVTTDFAGAMGTAAFDGWLAAVNVLSSHNLVGNGGSYSTKAADPDSFAGDDKAFGSVGNAFAGLSFDTTGLVGTNMNVYNVLSGVGAASNVTSSILNVAGFNPYFSFDQTSGMLSYTAVAAVPEADTSAMILAGIGLMGFIARRRKS